MSLSNRTCRTTKMERIFNKQVPEALEYRTTMCPSKMTEVREEFRELAQRFRQGNKGSTDFTDEQRLKKTNKQKNHIWTPKQSYQLSSPSS